MSPTPAALGAIQTLCVGFALAGLVASGYEWLTRRRAGFQLLEAGGRATLLALPLVAFAAPFLILRNTLRARGDGSARERRPIPFVMLATMIACGWSLLSGKVAVAMVYFWI